ncbi:MAG: hypothetical protein COB19_01640 [Porticoccus sp.]|nr:MAG: hypothetical protein COB19_01640 [Porticoccus sp.]
MSLAYGIRSKITSLFLASSLLLVGGNASAALLDAFENGGFDGYTGNTNSFNGDVPPGWTVTDGTPDVFNENTNIYGFAWQSSSTGGDFLHGIGWDGRFDNYVESALQVGLGGLVIGQQYEISFEQTISNSNNGANVGGYWEIIFGAESQNSEVMDVPTFGETADWIWQTLIFTATSEIQTLEVVAHSATGPRTDLGIDSFFLGDPGTNPDNPDTPTDPDTPPTALPVPGSLPLLGLGLGALLLVARRQRQS